MRWILLFAALTACGTSNNGECVCTEEYAPVCGDDGVTYDNSCFADCEDVTYTDGACDSGM